MNVPMKLKELGITYTMFPLPNHQYWQFKFYFPEGAPYESRVSFHNVSGNDFDRMLVLGIRKDPRAAEFMKIWRRHGLHQYNIKLVDNWDWDNLAEAVHTSLRKNGMTERDSTMWNCINHIDTGYEFWAVLQKTIIGCLDKNYNSIDLAVAVRQTWETFLLEKMGDKRATELQQFARNLLHLCVKNAEVSDILYTWLCWVIEEKVVQEESKEV